MVYVFFIGLGIAAFLGTLLWRRKITRKHQEFKTKMEMASDEEHAKRLLHAHLRKQQRQGTVKKD